PLCPSSIHVRLRIYSPSALFKPTATTEFYTLSLHDALPISAIDAAARSFYQAANLAPPAGASLAPVAITGTHPAQPIFPLDVQLDRKSTRLNSSHGSISYAVFCLTKNKGY